MVCYHIKADNTPTVQLWTVGSSEDRFAGAERFRQRCVGDGAETSQQRQTVLWVNLEGVYTPEIDE